MKLSVSRITHRLAAAGLAAALLMPVIGATPVAACDWGCTPGYWKNHTDMWGAYSQSMTLAQAGFVFAGADGITMLEALQGGGGPGLDGARSILLRAAVAALLNSNFPDGHAMIPSTVLRITNDAIRTGSRSWMLMKAELFDGYNNQYCPY